MTIETAAGPAQPMVLNMGPQHPSTHGVLRVILELDGETVLSAKSVIGYLHTGIEKSCESKTYSQCITLTDRIDYLSPLSNNLGFCLAAEKLIGIIGQLERSGHGELQAAVHPDLSIYLILHLHVDGATRLPGSSDGRPQPDE